MFLLLVLLIGASYAAKTIDVTVSNCTKSTDEAVIYSLVLNPKSPEQAGQNWTVTGTGQSEDTITGGTFTAVAKVAGIPIFRQSGDLCKPDVIQLPAGVGTIYYKGVTCPVAKGTNLVVVITTVVNTSAPDDTVKVSITAQDASSKNEIFCVDVVATAKGNEITY
eukprot:UN02787